MDNQVKNNTKILYVIEEGVKLFAFSSTFLWANLLVITTALFFLKQPLRPINFWLASVATLISLLAFIYRYNYHRFSALKLVVISTTVITLFVFTFLILLRIFSDVYDLSYDGQAYHQEAVIQLTRGWNPVYIILENQATGNLERWLNSYPKGVWIPEAAIYQLTGNIESGKAFGAFSLITAIAFCLWALSGLKNLPFWGALSTGLILALNPVSLYQSLSFYLDGILASWLLITGALLFKYVRSFKKELLWPLLASTTVLVNIKLTSIVFAGILFVGFLFYLWVSSNFIEALNLSKFFIVSFAIGALFVGYNPYLTNLALKGHPLYPAMGPGALDYTEVNMPENYWKMPAPVRFFDSIFSSSSLLRGKGTEASLKLPFTFSTKELETFRETNAKTGGFGPLFGGILVLSLVFLALNFVWLNSFGGQKLAVAGAVVGLLGTASIISTSSVSRFVPFVWWVPVLISLFLMLSPGTVWRFLGFVILIMLVSNLGLISSSYFPYNIDQSNKLKGQLTALSKNNKNPIFVDVGLFGSTIIKLRSNNIAYQTVSDSTTCLKRRNFLVRNVSQICELNN